MNQVNIIGNIGVEPETRAFGSGKRVMRFSIAVNSYNKERSATWIPCEIWDAGADRMLKCAERAKLGGRRIQITGSLALSEYTRVVGGTEMKQRKLYVKVQSFNLLSYADTAADAEPEPMVAEEAEAVSEPEPSEVSEPAVAGRRRKA